MEDLAPASRATLSTGPAPAPTWSLDGLARGHDEATTTARAEALEIAQALAGQYVALASDAGLGEYEDRRATLERGIWPDNPLAGYRLQSSFGAYLIARLAIGWALPSSTRPREVPLERSALESALHALGVEEGLIARVLGTFSGVTEDFEPDPQGLDVQRLAGLAEATLTGRERSAALAQAAYGPRCLSRLAAVAQAVAQARAVLPALPRPGLDLGAGYAPAVAAIVLGRPDRALDLLGYRPEAESLTTLAELAQAAMSLERGEPASWPQDPALDRIPLEAEAGPLSPASSSGASGSSSPASPSDDEDDVVAMVEERVAGGEGEAAPSAAEPSAKLPELPSWYGSTVEPQVLRTWQDARLLAASPAARRGTWLGMTAEPLPPALTKRALPPDPEALAALAARGGKESIASDLTEGVGALGRDWAQPIFLTARAALRAVLAASRGVAPTAEAAARAGDLGWLVGRARVLALGVRGDLERARAAATLIEAPESRWVADRARRYALSTPEPASREEASRLARTLVQDLALALLRTVAGAL